MTDPRTSLLQKATEKVTGKSDNYDTPERSFSRIAHLWTWWLGREVDERDVAAMMMLLKMSRLHSDKNHYDSLLDLAGYAACYGEVVEAHREFTEAMDQAARTAAGSFFTPDPGNPLYNPVYTYPATPTFKQQEH